jgi:hypothetical protein
MVPPDLMAGYVSTQVYALRYFSATSGQPLDHWGFAWAPLNSTGLSPADFARQTDSILVRLAASIRDSADTSNPSDPGGGACGPPGENLWCVGDLPGARFNDAWKSFRVWTQPILTFATAPQTIPAGAPSAAMSLALTNTRGQPLTPSVPLTVTMSSSSPQGTFSTTPTGPWSGTLSLAIAAGTSTSGAFYYEDTRAGSPVLTASAPETTSGTQTETVTPGPAVSLVVTPTSATVRARGSAQFSASGQDSFGNPFPVSAMWSLTPKTIGSVSSSVGSAIMFTALRTLGDGMVTASLATATGTLSATATVHVIPGLVRVGLVFQGRMGFFLVSIRTTDSAGLSVSDARVSITLLRNGRPLLARRVRTGSAGRVSFPVHARRGGCFTATITSVTAAGFMWDGRTPRNRFCRQRSSSYDYRNHYRPRILR